MISPSPNSIETYWSGHFRAATRKIALGKTWLILAIAVGSVAAMLSLSTFLSRSQRTVVSGRIVSAQTKTPISDVMVAVDSPPSEDTSFSSYVRTDSEGKFVAEIKGSNVYLRAWKPGYLMNGVDSDDAGTLTRQAITLELRELGHSNLAKTHDDLHRIKSGDGYSVSQGKIVDSADADITVSLNPDDNTSVIIESLGDGGIMLQPETEILTFGTASEAPITGYQKRILWPCWPGQGGSHGGFLFVLARDGKHYAKLALGVPVVDKLDGLGPHVDLAHSTRFYGTYQPDGSRVLDSNPTKYSFPFSEFGIDADSLNR